MNHYFLKLLLIVVIVIMPLSAVAKQKIMILGDSLSAAYRLDQADGWVYLLQNKYDEEQKGIELINFSVSGQTTGNALSKLKKQLQKHKPTHVLIELGANDGLRGFPIKRLEQNLTRLVEKSQSAGADVALMEIQIPPNFGKRYTTLFTDTFSKVANKESAYLLPYFMLPIAADKSLMQNDNLHPNKAAQPIIRDFMYDEISKWLNAVP